MEHSQYEVLSMSVSKSGSRHGSPSSWGCECLSINLGCFTTGYLSFNDHLMNCGRCIATFSSGCREHGCLLKNYWRSHLCRVCTKSRLASCSGDCLDPDCLCVHLNSEHSEHWSIPFVVCYDDKCEPHAALKDINKCISLPLFVMRKDMENCPCFRSTCTCIGYSSHPFHAAVHACRCYDQSCLIHYIQKMHLRFQSQDPCRRFTSLWLHSLRENKGITSPCSRNPSPDQSDECNLREDESDEELFIVC
jgi:hypothetical protein